MPTHFTPEALKFLRGLARHNDRAWFEPRRPNTPGLRNGKVVKMVDASPFRAP